MDATKSVSKIVLMASVLGALLVSAYPAVAAGDTTYAGWMVSRDTSAFLWSLPPVVDRWNSKGTSTSDDVQP